MLFGYRVLLPAKGNVNVDDRKFTEADHECKSEADRLNKKKKKPSLSFINGEQKHLPVDLKLKLSDSLAC